MKISCSFWVGGGGLVSHRVWKPGQLAQWNFQVIKSDDWTIQKDLNYNQREKSGFPNRYEGTINLVEWWPNRKYQYIELRRVHLVVQWTAISAQIVICFQKEWDLIKFGVILREKKVWCTLLSCSFRVLILCDFLHFVGVTLWMGNYLKIGMVNRVLFTW